MKILNLFKFLVLLGIIGLFSFLYARLEYYKFPVNSSRLEDERKNAFFLELNEEKLKDVKEKKEFLQITDVEVKNLGKKKLFEPANKSDYNF